MQKYAVIGYPLTHTLSPQIHNNAFQNLNIDAVYEKIEIHPDDLKDTLQQLRNSRINGFNVTIPHKLSIISFLDQIDPDANTIGAVNTVVSKENKWIGYNTDVKGFLTPLINYKEQLEKCLVLGTGGAARAVVFALAKYLRPKSVTIAGRNTEKAAQLNKTFNLLFKYIIIDHQSLEEIYSQLSGYSLIINATPLGTFPDIESTPLPHMEDLSENTIVYDLVYNPLRTKFLNNAEKAGKNIRLIGGLEMLIQQAAIAFKLWTNQEMPVDEVREYLSKLEDIS
jgi:shikimate dehydrogenase